MGNVVCLSMALGLVQLTLKLQATARTAPWILLILGFWNAGWYGLQHWPAFWGVAALVSGLFMLLAALLCYIDAEAPAWGTNISRFRGFIVLGLSLSFLLYAITLVRLNLGLSIL